MRLTSLTLENYGNFAALRVPFDPRPGRVNLVLAPNGAGKTVLRRGFRDLLFGIPGQSEMAFRFGYAGMRLFAEGVDGEGRRFGFGRRKGNGNTLIDTAGAALDPQLVERLTGQADEALFERLFALDSQLLRSGADQLLAAGGDLAEALFAAGSGIAGIRAVRDEFERLRDERAPVRKRASAPLYCQLEALAAARRDRRLATVRPQEWQEREAALLLAGERRRQLVRDQATGQEEIRLLERIRRVRPWLERLAQAREQGAAAANAPRLAPDIAQRWDEARRALAEAEATRRSAVAELERVGAALAATRPDRILLDEGERIDELDRERNRIAADHRDLPKRQAEHKETAARLAEILRILQIRSPEDLARIAPNGPAIAAARDLLERHAVLSQRLHAAEADLAKKARETEAAAEAFGHSAEPAEIGGLAALLAEIRADGEPPRRRAEMAEHREREQTRLAAALAKLPLWEHDAAALAAIVPPTRAAIDRAAAAVDQADAAVAETVRDVERLRREEEDAGERLAGVRAGRPAPEPAAISAARAERDRGWSLIRRAKFEHEALEADIALYAGALGLAQTFERAIAAADDLADRRDAESGRLAAIAEQQRLIAGLGERQAKAAERLESARAAQRKTQEHWLHLVAPLGLSRMPDAGDLRDFVAQREAVLDRQAAAAAADRAYAAELARQEAARRRLMQLLPAAQCGSLDEALIAADQAVEQAAAARQQRSLLHDRLAMLRDQHRQAIDECDAAQAESGRWQAEWADCLARLGRPPAETPAAVKKAIELIETAHDEQRRLVELEDRIAGMRANIEGFATRLADLLAALAPGLLGQPPEAGAAELRRRLAAHREIAARHTLLAAQQQDASAKLADAETAHRRASADRDDLRREIGGESDDEAARLIELAARRSAAEERLTECEAQLAVLGDNWPVDRLIEEAAAIPAAEIEPRLAALHDGARRIGKEREEAALDEERLGAELKKIAAGDDAIEAEERRQAALAALNHTVAEAMLHHAAACLLRRAIERLRGEDGGLVGRIGAAFAQITGGAYSRVHADEDDSGAPYLVAIEAGGAEKRVGQLSEGTRDQLFLALRLVLLQDYAAKAPALPFVADDLLQTFDDYRRTGDALSALAELSQDVQVIVLSHHRHLAELAKTALGAAVEIVDLAA